MNIQPLVEVDKDQFKILERLSIEHDVTVEQYLVRIVDGHIKYMMDADRDGYLTWIKTS